MPRVEWPYTRSLGMPGYAAVAYDQSKHILYAARVVGFLDLPKLVKWLNQVAEVMVGASKASDGQTLIAFQSRGICNRAYGLVEVVPSPFEGEG